MSSAEQAVAVPAPWFGSAAERSFESRLAASPKRTLLLDYDGTLAPFHPDKMQAFPYPGVVEILQQLHERGDTRLVLVTGRRVADLPKLIELANEVEIWGSHGREHIDRTRQYTLYPPTKEQGATLARLQHEIEADLQDLPLELALMDLTITSHGSQPRLETPEPLEKKPASIAIHWRGLTGASQERIQASADAAYRLHGDASIERMPFESGVEFRATGYTKAFAVSHELEHSAEGTMIAFLGDDLTDEDAFAALDARGETLLVRPEVRPSHARHWLRPPDELLRFLKSWV